MAVATPIVEGKEAAPAKAKKVLMYSIYPGFSINVGKTRRKMVELVGGERYLDTVGTHRCVMFKNHKLWVEASLLENQIDPLTKRVAQRGIRYMGGYGFDFIEAVRSKGIPAGAFSLEELRTKSPGEYNGFFTRAAHKAASDRTVTPLTTDMVRDDIDGIKSGTLTAPEGEDDE